MDEPCRMQIIESNEKLIDDVFSVHFLESTLIDGVIEIRVHILEDQINIPTWLRRQYLVQFDDIWMFQLFQDRNLAKSALGVSAMLERFEHFL